ncbi:precorrin-2 C(20)-methyltransferase [Halanaerobacter jeridensis]|uniref:Precorrin-2/cobalt-factor-2 C20-methyltransferase n=1 Tax=Halanaerobacter jeridensis TaxID=706427 RepID=A0A939BPP5_9FIRM|nr:precorrin-2 C(20)-methyltransferase [Halanaerobacter jeridensis]MBM7557123.1 precorrin-2/cobalt-factor-2 C20-methyltransferase [Halanaerobacter jeridensis]
MKQGKLYGLGVGPGDPELLTLKSKRILEEVDVVCTPQSKPNKSSLAWEIITEIVDCQDKIKAIHFPMTSQQKKLETAWKQAAEEIINLLEQGRDVALITIGDPLFYSTYSYIMERIAVKYPQQIETIPGVSSINACSSQLNLPLAQGDEKVAVIPVSDNLDEMESGLLNFENIILLKVSRNYGQVVKLLEKLDLKDQSTFISRCGQEEEFVTTDLDALEADKIDYLSQIIVKKK